MATNRTILITGASSGIGKALAEAYAAPGTRLLLTGRNTERLAQVTALCMGKGAAVETALTPVTDSAAFAAQLLAWDDAAPIDIVIANAGISGGTGKAGGESDAQFRDIMQTNLDGTFNTVNPLLPRFMARKKGAVVLMSSMAGFRGMPTAPAYSVSKMAVRAYGEALRPLLKDSGVNVNVIFPGFIKTPLTDVNNFPMPFLMDAEGAAQYIIKGIAANRARIAFPWPMYLLSRFVAALPLWAGDFILARAPKKS
ncbi:MAG: SDR family NAD(P)-dependent oxidoreductase [Micavibrio sp.]|nr:SDR family NAD(P)-dependent oxidoreductase [Micavibrio sp.]